MEKTFSEETEGSQMGEALAAVSGASPYQPKDLSDSIKDIVILVCNYCEKPTIRKQTKMKVVNGLIGMLKETNGFLSYCIEDLKQARCIEPFCLSSKQDDDHHLFWTFIEKLCEEIRDEEAYPILKCLIAQFNSLLAEAEIAKLNCDPIVFKEFYLRKKEEFNYENVPPDEPIGIPSDQPQRWIAVALAMAIQECGTESLDFFAMLRGWSLVRA